MNGAAAKAYNERLRRVLRHIDGDLGGALSVEALSELAAFSKFHFHRQFAAMFGLGVHRYVQLARLKRAAYRLAFRDRDPVTEIALDAGYEGSEAFARAFKQRVGQTPSAFRRAPQWASWQAIHQPLTDIRTAHMRPEFQVDQVRIVDVPATPVAILRHRGDPAGIGDTIRRFIQWRREAGLHPGRSATFNLLYDDPEETPPEAFRLDLCAATDREVAPNAAGVVAGLIPAGRCAVLRLVGPDAGLGGALTYLYAHWLPQSGEALRDFPPYCQRLIMFPDVPEHEAVTDVFLPLE